MMKFNKTYTLVIGLCALGLGACVSDVTEEEPPNESPTSIVDEALSFDGVQQCGGIAGLQCPADARCVDRPGDGCNPQQGGTDCMGVCVYDPIQQCAGFAGLECPPGGICIDDPRDKCDPDAGGADCPGVCLVGDGVSE